MIMRALGGAVQFNARFPDIKTNWPFDMVHDILAETGGLPNLVYVKCWDCCIWALNLCAVRHA
jgi:hypothetical protein